MPINVGYNIQPSSMVDLASLKMKQDAIKQQKQQLAQQQIMQALMQHQKAIKQNLMMI